MKKAKVIDVGTGEEKIVDMVDEPTEGFISIPVFNDIKDVLEYGKKNDKDTNK